MNYFIPYFEIAAFLASLATWRYIIANKALRLFPLLLFIIVVTEVKVIFFKSPGQINNAWIYNIQVPLQYIIYLFILYNDLHKPVYKKLMIIFMLMIIIITAFTISYYSQNKMFDVYSYSFGSIFLIIAIVLKFYEMLQHPAEFNFLQNPFFYILFAFLMFNVGTLPYFAMANWLYFVKGYKSTVQVLANVMSILNYVLYTTYTIAFIWMIRMKGSF